MSGRRQVEEHVLNCLRPLKVSESEASRLVAWSISQLDSDADAIVGPTTFDEVAPALRTVEDCLRRAAGIIDRLPPEWRALLQLYADRRPLAEFSQQCRVIAQAAEAFEGREEGPQSNDRLLKGFCVWRAHDLVRDLHATRVVTTDGKPWANVSTIFYRHLRGKEVNLKHTILAWAQREKIKRAGWAEAQANVAAPDWIPSYDKIEG